MFKVLNLIVCLFVVSCTPQIQHQQTLTQQQSSIEKIQRGFDLCIPENDKYPCVVALHTDTSFVGSGVLISPYYVLTAGHCIADRDITEIRLFTGERYCVRETIEHPHYAIGPYVINDIGLLALDEPVLTVKLYPMCENMLIMYKHQDVDLSGYGGAIKRQSQYKKFAYYGILIHEINQFKILPVRGSVWFGDSGGGAFAYIDGEKQLIGIISSFSAMHIDDKMVIVENSCVRVDRYLEWIHTTID